MSGQCAAIRIRTSWSSKCPRLAPESGVVPSVREKAVRDLDQGRSVPLSSRGPRKTLPQNRRVRNSANPRRVSASEPACECTGPRRPVASSPRHSRRSSDGSELRRAYLLSTQGDSNCSAASSPQAPRSVRTRTISLGVGALWGSDAPELRNGLSGSDREIPVFTGVNGMLMSWRSWPESGQWPARPSVSQAGHMPSWPGSCERSATARGRLPGRRRGCARSIRAGPGRR
jgi:hypothetical protein